MRRTAYGRRGMEMENKDQTKELKRVNESINLSTRMKFPDLKSMIICTPYP